MASRVWTSPSLTALTYLRLYIVDLRSLSYRANPTNQQAVSDPRSVSVPNDPFSMYCSFNALHIQLNLIIFLDIYFNAIKSI